MGRVHGKRRQHRENVRAKELAETVLLVVTQLIETNQVDAFIREGGTHDVMEDISVAVHELVGALNKGVDEAGRAHPCCAGNSKACGETTFETRHPHHKELVQVRRENREKPGTLKQRRRVVFRKLKHALVEREPTEFAIKEAILRQTLRGVVIGLAWQRQHRHGEGLFRGGCGDGLRRRLH